MPNISSKLLLRIAAAVCSTLAGSTAVLLYSLAFAKRQEGFLMVIAVLAAILSVAATIAILFSPEARHERKQSFEDAGDGCDGDCLDQRGGNKQSGC